MTKRSVKRGGDRRGFALLLVLLLGFVCGTALAILLMRSASAARAAQSQIDGYRLHHTQAGLRQISEVWAQMFRRVPERDIGEAVIGFDLVLEDGEALEVRFSDMQGGLRQATTDLPEDANSALTRAAGLIKQQGQATAHTVRLRGPGRVSLLTAPREVLEAVALGVSEAANAGAFAAAVLDKRATGRIEQVDIPALAGFAGLSIEDTAVLQNCVTTEPQLWFVIATLRTTLGDVADRQGGLVLGSIRTAMPAAGSGDGGTTTAASVTAAASGAGGAGMSGQSVSWTVLTWTKLPLRGDTDSGKGWSAPGL